MLVIPSFKEKLPIIFRGCLEQSLDDMLWIEFSSTLDYDLDYEVAYTYEE